jgi:hypothetical protein
MFPGNSHASWRDSAAFVDVPDMAPLHRSIRERPAGSLPPGKPPPARGGTDFKSVLPHRPGAKLLRHFTDLWPSLACCYVTDMLDHKLLVPVRRPSPRIALILAPAQERIPGSDAENASVQPAPAMTPRSSRRVERITSFRAGGVSRPRPGNRGTEHLGGLLNPNGLSKTLPDTDRSSDEEAGAATAVRTRLGQGVTVQRTERNERSVHVG